MNFLSNWKTTVAGVGAIAGAIASLCAALTTTPVDITQLSAAGAGLVAGLGLLAARDYNVTGKR